MGLGSYIQLLKLRIGGMIGLTAVVAYLAVTEEISLTHILVLFVVMLLGSGSSAVLNHYYDRDIDREWERTANRPLARAPLGAHKNVLWLAAALLLSGITIAVWQFNSMVALHIFLGAFIYGVVYTIWLKRRTWLNIVFGGLAGSFAVLAGAASVEPQLHALPLLFALVLFFWTPSHFWSLAIFLKEDYRKVGIPMLPVIVGEHKAARYIFLNSLFLVASSLLMALYGNLGNIYLLGALVVGAIFLYGNWQMIQEPSKAIARSNFFGSMKYLGGLFMVLVLDVHL